MKKQTEAQAAVVVDEALFEKISKEVEDRFISDMEKRLAGWQWGPQYERLMHDSVTGILESLHAEIEDKISSMTRCELSTSAIEAALRQHYSLDVAAVPAAAPRRPKGEWPMSPDLVIPAVIGRASMQEIADRMKLTGDERVALSQTIARMVREKKLIKIGERKASRYMTPDDPTPTPDEVS